MSLDRWTYNNLLFIKHYIFLIHKSRKYEVTSRVCSLRSILEWYVIMWPDFATSWPHGHMTTWPRDLMPSPAAAPTELRPATQQRTYPFSIPYSLHTIPLNLSRFSNYIYFFIMIINHFNFVLDTCKSSHPTAFAEALPVWLAMSSADTGLRRYVLYTST